MRVGRVEGEVRPLLVALFLNDFGFEDLLMEMRRLSACFLVYFPESP